MASRWNVLVVNKRDDYELTLGSFATYAEAADMRRGLQANLAPTVQLRVVEEVTPGMNRELDGQLSFDGTNP